MIWVSPIGPSGSPIKKGMVILRKLKDDGLGSQHRNPGYVFLYLITIQKWPSHSPLWPFWRPAHCWMSYTGLIPVLRWRHWGVGWVTCPPRSPRLSMAALWTTGDCVHFSGAPAFHAPYRLATGMPSQKVGGQEVARSQGIPLLFLRRHLLWASDSYQKPTSFMVLASTRRVHHDLLGAPYLRLRKYYLLPPSVPLALGTGFPFGCCQFWVDSPYIWLVSSLR